MSAVAPGLVSLVGAGPGHPDYLTLKGRRCLRAADIVFHDALVSRAVLEFAAHAEWVDVGKRAGRDSTPQEVIEAAMVAASRRGLRVVRLKGGDAFVFGRGGEEALALERQAIPYEIVPGVSAAIAAPALGGIPVTHRGVSSAVLVVSGADPADFRGITATVTPGSCTVVVLMGLRVRDVIADILLDSGWPASTPAAMVLGASTGDEFTWRGTLAGLADAEPPVSADALPGTLVIGAVAGLPLRLCNGVQSQTEVLS